jgi:hypothetical protein
MKLGRFEGESLPAGSKWSTQVEVRCKALLH